MLEDEGVCGRLSVDRQGMHVVRMSGGGGSGGRAVVRGLRTPHRVVREPVAAVHGIGLKMKEIFMELYLLKKLIEKYVLIGKS